MEYTYEEVIQQIEHSRRFGAHTGLEVSHAMLKALGNPHSGISYVHIAGTNGKGSTTAFMSKILEQSGKKIGMFTSPHLVTFEERIRINGEYIDKDTVTRLGNLLLNTRFELTPTMFDYCLAMAALYFKEQGCDLVLYETGIGGRYDSTNALGTPMVSVITRIGKDHTAILGETIEAIAGEKAGIIKPGAPVVSSPQEEEAAKVLWENYLEVNSLGQGSPFCSQINKNEVMEPKFVLIGERQIEETKSLPMGMLGAYQLENASTAIAAARIVLEDWEVPKDQAEAWIREGIATTYWKGRLDLLNQNPFFLVDGAHNGHGVHALAESLKQLYPGEKFHFIMAVMADKDYEEMIQELLPLAKDFVTLNLESERALAARELAECIMKKGVFASYGTDLEAVIAPYLISAEEAFGDVGQEKTIAFGSLYFIGAIYELMEKMS